MNLNLVKRIILTKGIICILFVLDVLEAFCRTLYLTLNFPVQVICFLLRFLPSSQYKNANHNKVSYDL